jgi:hypothetical protein
MARPFVTRIVRQRLGQRVLVKAERSSTRKSLGDAFASPVRYGLLASYLLFFLAAFFVLFLAAFFVAIVSILPSIFDG